ncbi:G5 and 3D domain-containing protein [Amphibacillus sediminis]|uniref:G5 and 3D domain-containing protein n=1 Tax=Amphibacillus sediminis TaxID=360185 RepID=UPI00082ECBC4|nr:G5 and 3D domain-containing protein [Amphibacillus sediminis]
MTLKSKLLPVLKNKFTISLLSLFALIFIIGFVVLEITKSELTVTKDGETETIVTRAKTVRDLLEELEIEVSKHDDLSHDLDAEIESDMHIQYKRAKQLSLIIDGDETTHYTTKESVSEFLDTIDVEVKEHDELNVAQEALIEDDLVITLDRAIQIVIRDAEHEEEVWTTDRTVAELLASESIELQELDRLEPEANQELTEDMTVTITRVEIVKDIVEDVLEFSTIRRNDSSLAQGTEEVVEPGTNGLIEKTYQVTLENGKEAKRELISEEVKKESEQRIVAVGTKVIEQTVSRGGSSQSQTSSSDTIVMDATAYNWNCSGCDGRGRTSTGFNLKDNPTGTIAVDPSVIPLGTRVYIEGYGYAVARDTGGSIKGNKIDIHMPTLEEAKNFGRKQVKVQILD